MRPVPHILGRAALALVVFGMLSGCGEDKPVTDLPPGSPGSSSVSPVPTVALPDPPAAAPDPLLSGNAAAPPADPLLQTDPLLGSEASTHSRTEASSDPLKGRTMPTEHSHWLNTEFSEAQVTILLNGLRLSTYQPRGTEDITMKLHSGPNTLTVLYTPRSARSWASVVLSEGEHQGEAIPLATVRHAPTREAVTSNDAPLTATTQTVTFFAK